MAKDQIVKALVKPADWLKGLGRDGGPVWTFRHYAISVTSREQYGVSPGIGIFPTLAAAQAAAEQDYRARIAAALNLDKIAGLVEAAEPFVYEIDAPAMADDRPISVRVTIGQHRALVAALAAVQADARREGGE